MSNIVRNELDLLMEDMAKRCGLYPNPPSDWSYKLWQLQLTGFHSFFKYRLPGMNREDLTALQRYNKKYNGWWLDGKLVSMELWVKLYGEWVAW
jgi:hypothetical protein